MTALVGALRVSLAADTANFEAGMRRAQRTTAKSAQGIQRSLGTVKASLAGLAAGITVGLFAKAIGNALEYAGSLAEVAQQLGVTAKQLQVYRFAAGQVGVSQEQLEVGLRKLNLSLGQAKLGAEAPKKAFAELSKIIGKDIVASSKQGGDALPLVADGLAKVADRSKRAGVEAAIFGARSGPQLDNLLSSGSAAINELSQAAEKLGIVLSDEQIAHADETADKLRAVKTVLEAQIAGVVASNTQSILSLASALGTLTSEIIKFLSSNPQLALGIIGAFAGSRAGAAFGPIGAAIGTVGGGIAGAAFGGSIAKNAANANLDKAFRRQEFIKAEVAYQRALRSGDTGGRVMPGVGTPLNDVKALKAERDRQAQLFKAAIIAAKRPQAPPPPAGVNIGSFLAPGGSQKKPKEDHTAEKMLREEKQFADDMRRAQTDTLTARRDLAHSADEQASLDIQILDKQKEQYEADLAYEVQLNKLTKGAQGLTQAQADQLKQQYDATDALKRQAIAEDLVAQNARTAAQILDNKYDLQIEQLQLEADLATNSKARRDAELRILAVMKEQERARLEAVIADQQSSKAAKAEAQARLAKLDNIYAGRAKVTAQQNAGPLDQLANSVRDTTDAMEQLKVDGINGAVDSIIALTDGFQSFRDTAISAIKQVIAELLRMQLLKFAFSLIGGGGGGGFGSLFSAAGDTTNSLSIVDAPQFASGGSLRLGGMGGIDRNILSLNGLPIARVSKGEMMHIVPNGGGMGGGPVINFNINGNVSRETMNQIAARTQSALATARRSGIS